MSGAADGELRARARRRGPLLRSELGPGPPADLPVGIGPAVAAELDEVWEELGRPDPFVVVEDGAGDGSLAAAVLRTTPRCAPALRYLTVESDPRLRAEHARLLPLESPASVLGPVLFDDEDVAASPVAIGPMVASLAGLPGGLRLAVVLAVGWISRLRLDDDREIDGAWWGTRMAPVAGGWTEVVVPVPGPSSADPGSDWLAQASRVAEDGRVVVIDAVADTEAGGDEAGTAGAALRRMIERRPPQVRRPLSPFANLDVVQWAIVRR